MMCFCHLAFFKISI